MKVKRVGVLHDSGYGNVVMNALKSISASYPGIEFVAIEKFEIGATDVTTQAAKVRAANPETVMVIATSGTPFRAVKQVRLEVPVIAAIGSSSYEYVKAMGEGADNVVIPEFLVGEDPLPGAEGVRRDVPQGIQPSPEELRGGRMGYGPVHVRRAAGRRGLTRNPRRSASGCGVHTRALWPTTIFASPILRACSSPATSTRSWSRASTRDCPFAYRSSPPSAAR